METQLTPAKSGYAPVNGLELYYEIYGEGQPTILLHGGFGMIQMFEAILPTLAEGRQIIGVDLHGHGRTALNDRPMSTEAMSDDVAALIAHLGLEQADIIGYSMGAKVALQTAIRHPEKVRKAVIISTAFKRSGWYPEVLQGMDAIGPDMADSMKPSPIYQHYAQIAPHPEEWVKLVTNMGNMVRGDYDHTEGIAGLTMPIMIVIGDADSMPPSHAAEFFGLLGGGKGDAGWDGSGMVSDSQLAILPGKTHYNIVDSPEVVAAITPFLDAPMPGEKVDLILTRVFDAPIEQLWQAWHDPELVKQWWGPNGFTVPLAEMDFCEGGTSLVCMSHPDVGTHYSTWHYTAIVPMQLIEYIHNLSDENGNKIDPASIGMPADFPQDQRQVITFKSLNGGKTEVTVTEYDWTPGQMMTMSEMGMNQCLDKMAAALKATVS